MQLSQPQSPAPNSGQDPAGGLGHPEVSYTAPAFGHDGAPAPQHHPDYNFIMDPTSPRAKKINLPTSSLMGRVAIVAGGLTVLFIVFIVFKSILGGSGSNSAAMVSVAQQQQVLIHISTAVKQQPGISIATQNSSATIFATMTSAQQDLITYLKTNHQKVSSNQLIQKESSSQDTSLTNAASAGTYDATYSSTIQTVLNNYEQVLKQAYAQTKGPKGKALLKEQFYGAEVLTAQITGQSAPTLNAPTP